jgi:hypothetical protein
VTPAALLAAHATSDARCILVARAARIATVACAAAGIVGDAPDVATLLHLVDDALAGLETDARESHAWTSVEAHTGSRSSADHERRAWEHMASSWRAALRAMGVR